MLARVQVLLTGCAGVPQWQGRTSMSDIGRVMMQGFIVTSRQFLIDLLSLDKVRYISLINRMYVFPGAFVIWDGEEQPDCWLVTGDDPDQIAKETKEAHGL